MDARKYGVKEDPAAEAAGELSGLEPIGQLTGVDFGAGDHLGLNDLVGPAGGGLGHAVDAPGPGGGVNDDLALANSPHRLALPLLGAERATGVDPAAQFFAPAGRGAGVRGRDGVFGRDMTGDLRPAGEDLGGPTMRHAALLAMMVGATTLIGQPDAPWPNKLRALLMWLAGCVTLFLSRN